MAFAASIPSKGCPGAAADDDNTNGDDAGAVLVKLTSKRSPRMLRSSIPVTSPTKKTALI
jgi:hypothetical protein